MCKEALRCPFCGYTMQTEAVGVRFCGPHRLTDGSYTPAVMMLRVTGRERLTRSANAENGQGLEDTAHHDDGSG